MAALAVAVAMTLGALASPAAAAYRVEMDSGAVAVLTGEPELYIEAVPERGEGLLAFARRFCDATDAAAAIVSLNGDRQLLAGVRYRIPFSLLDVTHQLHVLEALFPDDRLAASGWHHRVSTEALVEGATLWSVARWFTGEGSNFRQVREANNLTDDQLQPGQTLVIPAALLRPVLRERLPTPPPGAELLAYRPGAGDDGVAVYRLRPGEALYSAVVMRFTGRIYAEDVNAVADEIAGLNEIDDVTDMPVGLEVAIPFELLMPEYLPPGHPRRQEYEAGLSTSQQFSNQIESRHLEGITVILDAGHGGQDVGASQGGVWESLYVYDIMLRTKAVLESTTAARVVPTVRDGDDFRIPDLDVLAFSRGHAVLTDPPYPIEDSKVGVNLRWYLANSAYRSTLGADDDGKKVVFVSIHADSIHPSLRGAMIYVPSTRLTAGRSGRSGTVYAARREVREGQYVEFSWRERTESEGLSREMAEKTLAAFRAAELPVHELKPVRDKIIRGRREFVPAVLRYNAVPAKILLEVCNLANDGDRKLIKTQAYRQRVAEALVQGILAYYGEDDDGPSPVRVARR